LQIPVHVLAVSPDIHIFRVLCLSGESSAVVTQSGHHCPAMRKPSKESTLIPRDARATSGASTV
jgi:hypothetical protein